MLELITERLRLRPYTVEDLPSLHALLSDPVTMSFWPSPYGYEAAEAIMRYGFDELKLNRICANMPVVHAASRNVAEKLGMVLEKEFANRRNRNIRTCLYAKHSGS